MLDEYPHSPPERPTTPLSRREVQVLEMAATGMTNSEIAGRLAVSVHAIKFHLASIYRKLGVGNRTEAAVLFLQAGTPRSEA